MREFLLLIIIAVGLSCNAQSLDGSWKGTLQAGTQRLTLVLNVNSASKTVLMDVVEQGASKIPMTVNFLSGDSINVTISQLMLSYCGRLENGELKGTFQQQFFTAPLDFKKGDVTYNRPQEPKEPFPYTTEEVSFVNSQAGDTLRGTLSYPVGYKKGSKVPVVLMVTGSGAQNRDEEIFHHKPFLVIADYLARNGIASLRYDDRGTASSTGDFATATTADFADDASAGIDWLRKSGSFSHVGILGHSEGGLIAYMLGSKGKVDFIVSLAGPACRIDTMLMVQLNGLARAQGSPVDIVKSVAEARQFMLKDESPWMKYFVDIDATKYVKATKCPVLALAGDKDLNVPISINNPSLEANFPKNSQNVIKVYKGLSHLFQPSATGNPFEAVNIEETISPEVLSDIAEWINK